MTIQDIHSGDLTADCMRSVQLRHEGKILGDSTTALYRGNLWHEACALVHKHGVGGEFTIDAHVRMAHSAVVITATRENRPLTQAVNSNATEIQCEIVGLMEQYVARVLPIVNAGTLIGTEVPIRLTLDIDGEPQDFASHLDLLVRFPGCLAFYDWKSGEDQPGFDFLRRSLQLGLYSLMIAEGECMIDGEWIAFGEWPAGHWVHVNSLAVYKRKTKAPDGEEYAKGDSRPLDKIVMETGIGPQGRDALVAELTTRVRMFRQGLYPTNPGEQRCRFCESRTFCPTF